MAQRTPVVRVVTKPARPYAESARTYRDLGWAGVIPVDLGKIGQVPPGFTGRNGDAPDDEEVRAWTDTHGGCNVGLRLPETVVGIDVDCYGDKLGCETMEWWELEVNAGSLPATCSSTARDDGSAIFLYRVPHGRRWITELPEGGVEIIQHAHRWARVWPSLNPKTGQPYRWFGPDGNVAERPPRPDELAELPDAWVEALTKSSARRESDSPIAGIPTGDLLAGVPEGERHNRLLSVAGRLWAQTGDREVVAVQLLHMARNCRPPHDEDDVAKIVEWIVEQRRSSFDMDSPEAAWARGINAQRDTGWVDVGAIIAEGRPKRSPPSVMSIQDWPDMGLLYAAKYNTVFGDSEVGKSLLTAAIHAFFIKQRLHTVHLEFDGNNPDLVAWTIVDAGAPAELVAEYFHVLELPTKIPEFDFAPAFASLDAINPAVTALGLNLREPEGIDRMIQLLLYPFISRGACALALDHVGHEAKAREAFTIRKRQATSGIAYRMEVIGHGGKVGGRWASKLIPVKDRPGMGPAKERVAAYAVVDGTPGDGTFTVELWRDPPLDVAHQHATAGDTPELRVALLQIVGDAVIEKLSTSQVHAALRKRGIEKDRAVVLRRLRDLHDEELINGKKTGDEKTAGWVWWAR